MHNKKGAAPKQTVKESTKKAFKLAKVPTASSAPGRRALKLNAAANLRRDCDPSAC
jgi:hypothetical protein